MAEKRQYYFIKIPNGLSKHSKNVCVGDACYYRKSINGSTAYIKTTQPLIDKEVAKGVGIDKIFPPGLTEKVTYEVAKERLRSIEFQENLPQ